MEEELPSTDLSVTVADTTDFVEENSELTVLRPLSYDDSEIPANKSEASEKMDVDDNVDAKPKPESVTSVNNSGDAQESAVKLNGVMNHTESNDTDNKTPDSSPNATTGKSRYGRVRRPKLSTDFISVDRKSFAVLNNTSSYEHVYADDTPRKTPGRRKKRSYRRKSPPKDEPSESNNTPTKDIEKVSYITQSLSVEDKVDSDASSNNASDIVKQVSAEDTEDDDVEQTEDVKDDDVPEPLSPLACKDPIKTYSRKGETSIPTSVNADDKVIANVDDQANMSPINRVELNWKVGDVAWAKIGCYPYWPSIVTLEYGSSIYVKSVSNRRLAVHVQFFGDRGRRSWVLTTSLIKYQSKEQFLELKQQYKKDKIRFKYYMIKPSFQDLWEKAINEADTVLKLPYDERIPYYQTLYPVSEETYVAEMNMLKVKQTRVYKKKNPEERRGRKRKILDTSLNDSLNQVNAYCNDKPYKPNQYSSQEPKKPRQSETSDTLPDSEVKKPRKLDEHTKKRRAFMRRMNKILRQSNNDNPPIKKGLQNGIKLQRIKNAKFNKLLSKENETKKPENQPSSSMSPEEEQKKKDMSVYDFESDEETDIFIGTYNSRFTPQLLAKIEQEKAEAKKSDDSEKPGTSEETKPISSNESKARLLFSHDRKPRVKHLPKGTGSKFSKLFEHRKVRRNDKRMRSKVAHQTKSVFRKLHDRIPKPTIESKDTKIDEDRKLIKKDVATNYQLFKEKTIDKVKIDHPEFTDEDISKYIDKLWTEMDEDEKSKYKPEEFESSEDDIKSSTENDDDSKSDDKRRSLSPSPLPIRPRKISNIFAGYKAEKVCQICEKSGDTVRCRGACAGYYHVDCVQKMATRGRTESKHKSPAKRGRKKKSSVRLAMKPADENIVEGETSRASLTESEPSGKDSSKGEFIKSTRRSKRFEENEKSKTPDDSKTKDDEIEGEAKDQNVVKVEKMETESLDDSQNDEPKLSIADEASIDRTSEGKKPVDDSSENTSQSEPSTSPVDGDVSTKIHSSVGTESKPVEDAELQEIKNKIKSEDDFKDNLDVEKDVTTVSDKDDVKDNLDVEKDVTTVSDKDDVKDNLDGEKDETAVSDVSENLSNSTKADSSNGIDFRCHLCTEGVMWPCFICGEEKEENTGNSERFSCYIVNCGRVFHKECLKAWPQTTWGVNSGKPKNNGSSNGTLKESLKCPQHYCHTCISDNPVVLKNKQGNEKLVRCIRCPTAYHQSVHCIPAGSELLTVSQIICPRHYEPPKMKSTHVNTSWCFICCIGGSLICCEECPTSFHAECLKLSPEEYEGRYICDDCQTGRYLLYGEVVWVKLGHYRWWPARVLYPNEIPENIIHLPHRRGEFAVRFFGSHDYNWVNRGRAFLYQEGDSGRKNCSRSNVDLTFEKALIEAEEAHQQLRSDKALRDEEAKIGLKPPRYTRIKSNKPVGNVRIVELNTSNIPDCKCNPDSERPCAPESDCLNRMLLVECNPRVCSAGERCLNQAFEKRVYPPLVPCKTDRRGWGLKTLVDIKKGDFIIEYVGEMIDEEEYKRRVNHMHKNQEDNYYFLTIDNNRMLDAGPKGNVSRFMNHSCDPNCETQKWTVNGDTRVGLFALKDIPANAELVFNYNLATLGNEKKPCFCGSEKCSGYIGVKASKNGNNGNGEEETRKRSNEGGRKRSLDETKNKLSTGRKFRKGKRKRKLMKKPVKKETPEKTPSSVTSTDENETDKTAEAEPSNSKTEQGEHSKIIDEKPRKILPLKKDKARLRDDTRSEEQKVLKNQTDDGNAEKILTTEPQPSAETTQPDVQPDVLERRSKRQSKISAVQKLARGKMKKILKKKEKLLQKRGNKILTTKKKAMKPLVKAAKSDDASKKKRGRKPHITEQDRVEALHKSLKKRTQRKLRFVPEGSKLDEICYVCGETGELIVCDNKKCPRGYHITCVKKFKFPKGRWLCPWHYCTVCNSKCKVIKCSKCVNSYCRLHYEDNMFVTRVGKEYICGSHKSDYLTAKLVSLPHVEGELANLSMESESLNISESSIETAEAESPLLPLKATKSKRPKVIGPRKRFSQTNINEPVVTDNKSKEIEKPIIIESRNVARRSKKLGAKPSPSRTIDNMEIDDYIEVHHVEAIELSENETNDAKSTSGEDDGTVDKNDYVREPVVSDDEYEELEMEVINDDSS